MLMGIYIMKKEKSVNKIYEQSRLQDQHEVVIYYICE